MPRFLSLITSQTTSSTDVLGYLRTEIPKLHPVRSAATLATVIDDLPRLSIGTWPTPIERMERASDLLGRNVWVKLEDECGAWGGNKVRKLEFILAAAQRDGVRTLVSYGTGTSNWTSALAFHASKIGLRTVAGVAGPIPEHYADLYDATRTKLVTMPWTFLSGVATVAARVTAGAKARSIPPGGSGGGDVGSLHAGFEVADSITTGELPEPKVIYVAAGTSGTAAGLASGLAVRGFSIPIVAVRVVPLPLGTPRRIETRIRALRSLLAERDISFRTEPRVLGDDRFFKPGYTKTNPASRDATEIAALDGVALDSTYAAKAFASLVDAARSGATGPFLFLHTSPGPPPMDQLLGSRAATSKRLSE